MSDTKQLIAELSGQATPVTPLRPRRYAAIALVMLASYAVCAQCWLEGFRPDIAMQLTRPLFVIELLLLAAMFVSASVAAIYAMIPGSSQQKRLMHSPYYVSSAMLVLVISQLVLPHDARMVMSDATSHTHECTMYIAYSSVVPAAIIFWLLKKGASVMPMQAGTLAVIASVSIGALTLRLAEANDEIMHLLSWHYIPSLVFAGMGAWVGSRLLRW